MSEQASFILNRTGLAQMYGMVQQHTISQVGHRIAHTGYPLHGENREMTKEIPFRENTGNLENLIKHRENTRSLFCSSCKFPDSKGKRYFDISRENYHLFS